MFTCEWLPYALSIGIDEKTFWTLNPRRIKPYQEAYRMRKQEENSMAYIQARYFLDALMATVGNMFKGKGQKAYEFPDKPYELFEKKIELSEEEKKRQRENLILSLKVMQFNFNSKHKKKSEGDA